MISPTSVTAAGERILELDLIHGGMLVIKVLANIVMHRSSLVPMQAIPAASIDDMQVSELILALGMAWEQG